jgi:hypothetical protein
VNDDWRVTLSVADGDAGALTGSVRELSLERDARGRLGDRVVVSIDGAQIYLYADTEGHAREAARQVRPLLERHDLRLRAASLSRWHPDEERWEDADVPLPHTAAAHEREDDALDADEVAESRAQGWPEWEVRVHLAERHQAVALAERLEGEGVPVVRRWRYLFVGAPSEEEGSELARRIQAEAPEGTVARVELTGRALRHEVQRTSGPFAVLQGLVG